MTDTRPPLHPLEATSIVVGLAVTGWIVWAMVMTPDQQARAKGFVVGQLAGYARGRRAAAQRRQVARQMQFEVFAATELMGEYGGDHDSGPLARALELAPVV